MGFIPQPPILPCGISAGREEVTPTHTLPVVGLCPKTPLKKAGIRMLPPMSEPTPMTEQAAASTLPSPPAQEKTWHNPTRFMEQIIQQSSSTSQ